MINGVARYGVPDVMGQLAPSDQTVRVGGQARRLFLKQETTDPAVAEVSLSQAATRLRTALKDIAKLAKETEKPKTRRVLDRAAAPAWSLALDEICACGVELGPRLPFDGPGDFTGPDRAPRALTRAAEPLSKLLKPIELDPLTVADDERFLDRIATQPNVPAPVRDALSGLY
jgi:hypothetical protein